MLYLRKDGSMELQDTIDDMISQDYQDRFRAEYNQVKIRRDKLVIFIDKYKHNELNFTPSCPIDMLQNQVTCMDRYLVVLETRADIEAITL